MPSPPLHHSNSPSCPSILGCLAEQKPAQFVTIGQIFDPKFGSPTVNPDDGAPTEPQTAAGG
ncbi:MAG: hypothetical protein SNJ81_03375, partial [Cyanobacteriota bacterium]